MTLPAFSAACRSGSNRASPLKQADDQRGVTSISTFILPTINTIIVPGINFPVSTVSNSRSRTTPNTCTWSLSPFLLNNNRLLRLDLAGMPTPSTTQLPQLGVHKRKPQPFLRVRPSIPNFFPPSATQLAVQTRELAAFAHNLLD